MKTVRPRILDAPVNDLPLTAEEGFVLSRIDGQLSVKELVALTGLEENRVEQIVTKLAVHGAVQVDGAGSSPLLPAVEDGTTSLADLAAVLGMDPNAFVPDEVEAPVLTPRPAEERVESRSNYPPPTVTEDSQPELAVATAELDESARDDAEPMPERESMPPAAADASENAEGADDAAASEVDERNYRQLYQTKFHPLTPDVRAGLARSANGPDLFALCLDPDPKIVAALLENPELGLDHVRVLAFAHRTGTGLEMLARRQDWIRDVAVERRLFRNPQTPETVLGRLLGTKSLLQAYKILVDREVPELTRTRVRGHFRKKWTSAAPEERADLMMRTEGRPLVYMTGCTFDARTTQIICGKTIASMLLIQNFAKFSATPPGILAHCMKQAFVRKNPGMRRLLLQHPNMPGEVKRSM